MYINLRLLIIMVANLLKGHRLKKTRNRGVSEDILSVELPIRCG